MEGREGTLMPWSPAIAERYIDILAADAAADAAEVSRLRRATPEDLTHPAVLRAFVRGACGFDVAHDADEQTLFYAVCLGDAEVFSELVERREALDRDWFGDRAGREWQASLDAFWARADIEEIERVAQGGFATEEAA
ncbi:hypothetical protein WMF38_57650 [Sorangium sp. So ce118]